MESKAHTLSRAARLGLSYEVLDISWTDNNGKVHVVNIVTGKNSTATLVDTELYYSFNLQHTQRNSL